MKEYKTPEFKPGDLSPELIHELLKSDWDKPRNEPKTGISRNTKIFLGSFVASDLITSAFRGEKPITIQIITALIWILLVFTGIYFVIKAIIWLIDTIGDLLFRGIKVLFGL
jgi:hypothetical protein